MNTVFRRQEEQDAYTLLHTQGLEAFQDEYGAIGTDLLNRWHEAGIARISHGTKTEYRLTVRTYKKYAGVS